MKPIIGISTNFLTVEKGKFLGMERIYVNKDYVDAVIKAGGTPLLLPPTEDTESIYTYAERCDGFILSGGGDINPLLYGEYPHPLLEEIHTGLDRAQWQLTEQILQTRKPILAICRGMQLLNVVLGGTLWQDRSMIDPSPMLHSQDGPRGDKFHPVDLLTNSILGRLYGSQLYVNSFHHQCLKSCGNHLKITAIAPDGVIEAIELTDRHFGLGVQWHPEMLLTADDEMFLLFQEFIGHSQRT